jgi:hypothetical protein
MGGGSRRRKGSRRRAEREATWEAGASHFRWGMYGWGCFLAFFGYLFLVTEVLTEPGPVTTLAHLLGVGIVAFGAYSAYRSLRSGRDLQSRSARDANDDLARLRQAGGTVVPVPAGARLPLTVDARPELVSSRARTSPLPWLVAAAACAGLSWRMSDELGWSFLLTLAGVVGSVGGIIGLAYATNRRGRIVLDAQSLQVRSGVRTRTLDRSSLQDAVDVTLRVVLPRAPEQYVTTVHVVGRDGRRAFSMGRTVFDSAGVATVLGVLQLPLHRVPGHHDPATVEALVPGSTSLVVRRPFLVVLGSAAVLVVVVGLGAVAWTSFSG